LSSSNVVRPSPQLARVLADYPGINQAQDVGVLQVGGNSDFLEKSFSAEYGSELGMQNLYGDLAVVFFVVREINGGHSAAAQLTLNGVSGERTLNLFNALSHFVRARQLGEATWDAALT